VFLISDGSDAAEKALPKLVMQIRRAGLHARHSWKATKNVGKLLSDAGKCRARSALILGAEMADGAVAIKDLDGGGQRIVPLEEVVATLLAMTTANTSTPSKEI
jgi:histidyl-tRNA synthetase